MWRIFLKFSRNVVIAILTLCTICVIVFEPKNRVSKLQNSNDLLCETEEFIALETYRSVAGSKPKGAAKIFFFETSGRPSLTPRQACAIESAARESKLDEVVVLLKSPFIRLGGAGNEAVCGLARTAFPTKVSFHSLDLSRDFEDTPLELFYKRGSFAGSKFPSTHLSDAIRAAFVFKYGGWYADLDYVIIDQLRDGLPNNTVPLTGGERQKSLHLTNSVFKFDEVRHPFLGFYMEQMTRQFQGLRRAELGPTFMNACLRKFCELPDKFNLENVKGDDSCHGMELIGSRFFSPVRPGTDKKYLFRDEPYESLDGWNELFKGSRAVHFYSSGSNRFNVTGDAKKEAYAYLGPKHCPFSYFRPAKFVASYIS